MCWHVFILSVTDEVSHITYSTNAILTCDCQFSTGTNGRNNDRFVGLFVLTAVTDNLPSAAGLNEKGHF